MNNVLNESYNIVDLWYCLEWKVRGSGHIHGFAWIDGGPLPEGETEYLGYWGAEVTAINPGDALPPAAVHPSSKPFYEPINTLQGLAEL